MRTRNRTIDYFAVLLVLSAGYLAVWHLMDPLTRTQMTYAVLYTYLARPVFWFCAGAVAVWVAKRAFPALDRPISRSLRTGLTVLTMLSLAFYVISLCLPPLFLVWVYIPWVYAVPGALAFCVRTSP